MCIDTNKTKNYHRRQTDDIDITLTSFTDLVRDTLVKECGLKPERKHNTTSQKPPKHTKAHTKLRAQKRKIRCALKKAIREKADKKYIAKLHFIRRKIIRSLNRIRKYENHINKTKELFKNQTAFNKNPHRFSKKLFSDTISGKPDFSADTCEDFFRDTYSDEFRDTTYQPLPDMPRPPLPKYYLKKGPPSWHEFSTMLRKRSNGSSPGPNGIPYAVYKNIIACARYLLSILCLAITTGHVPKSFGTAFITLIPKDPNNLDQPASFRPIACLNVEGKMFWAILSHRLIQFCRANNYLPGNIQKGFLPGLAGCLEHTSMLMAALRDAKRSNRTIIITWLDLANAYGSVRHHLIHFALSWFHIPAWVCSLIKIYYNALFAKIVTPDWETPILPFLIGVFQGCTISPILFNLVFQMCITYVEKLGQEPYAFSEKDFDLKSKYGMIQLLQQAYADDHTLLNRSLRGSQHSLNLVWIWLEWTRCMNAKPPKCRSLGLSRTNVWFRNPLSDEKTYSAFDPKLIFAGSPIAFIGKDPFKSLGRLVFATLSDSHQRKQLIQQVKDNMQIIDNI